METPITPAGGAAPEGSPGEKKTRRLKYIAILPSLITLMNGMCGFISIVCASRGPGIAWQFSLFRRSNVSFFALSGYLIFFAMIADVLDGHVARLSHSASSFGGQLDSLCDVISFGVAPGFLMMKLVEVHFQHLMRESFRLTLLLGRSVLLVGISYAMCAVIRLARFNVENKEDESAHRSFSGLPSPPAAGLIVSLVIFQQDFIPRVAGRSDELFRIFESITVWTLPFLTLLAGLLMVSRIPYPHVVNHLLRGKKSFATFLLVAFVLLLMIWNIQLAMVIGFSVFVLFGLIRWICSPLRRRSRAPGGTP